MTDVNKKVLILGGTGAMGVYVIPELLERGYEVVVTSRKERESTETNLRYLKGNAKDDEFLDELLKENYDAIIDFMIYRTDVFEQRYEKLLSNTKHYVFLSSYRVYADGGLEPLTEESDRLLDVCKDETYLATDEYALTKARQENILKKSSHSNWSILRPAITYSKDRFQLGTLEAQEFLYRAFQKKPIIFPKEMLENEATMSWAGDVARLIAELVLNKCAFRETFNVSTAEHHSWHEILAYYKEFLGVEAKIVSLEDYESIIGRPYQIKYDRMFNRVVDNSKVLNLTGIDQLEFMTLREGLFMELTAFSQSPKFVGVRQDLEKTLDEITSSSSGELKSKTRWKLRLASLKSKLKRG